MAIKKTTDPAVLEVPVHFFVYHQVVCVVPVIVACLQLDQRGKDAHRLRGPNQVVNVGNYAIIGEHLHLGPIS